MLWMMWFLLILLCEMLSVLIVWLLWMIVILLVICLILLSLWLIMIDVMFLVLSLRIRLSRCCELFLLRVVVGLLRMRSWMFLLSVFVILISCCFLMLRVLICMFGFLLRFIWVSSLIVCFFCVC